MVFHQIGNLQQSAVLGSDIIDAAIIVITFLYLTDNLDDFIHLCVFTQTAGCTGVDTRNMNDGLLGSIQHLGNMVEITAVIEVIAQDEVLEIAITVELLIIVIGYREETGLILSPQHRNAIATEVTASHGNDMTGGIVHHPSHNITQSAVYISTCMMKLIYRQETIIKLLVAYFLHAVSECSMGANQNIVFILMEEFLKAYCLLFLVGSIAKVILLRHPPIGKEAILHQVSILERAADTLFWHSHHHLLDTLVHQLIQSDEHQGATLARCRWCLDKQEAMVAGFVSLGLHLSHTEFICITRFTRLLIRNINDVIIYLVHKPF